MVFTNQCLRDTFVAIVAWDYKLTVRFNQCFPSGERREEVEVKQESGHIKFPTFSNVIFSKVQLFITRAWKATSLKSGSFFFWGQNLQALIGWGTISVTSRRNALAPRRSGRVVRALASRPESPEFGSHSQQFEIQGHAL